MGRPASSIRTNVSQHSFVCRREPLGMCSAKTFTMTDIEVRPTWTTRERISTSSPVRIGSLNSTLSMDKVVACPPP